MAENKFGKLSRLSLKTGIREGKTIVEDVAFTAPYKIMNPFPKKNGGISVMPLCASAGSLIFLWQKERNWNFCRSHLIKSTG